ncbi:MAG: class II aldolase/adducin family protein [Pseudorhodoferax sp.]
MNENAAREEICRVGASLFARGHVHATAGNISVRLDEEQGGGFRIPPTDACLGRLARLDARGVQLAGDRASKAIALRRRIYAASQAAAAPARCIVHTHGTHGVALTFAPPTPMLEALEETAKSWLLTRRAAPPLANAQIADLRQTFGAHW